VLDSEGRTPLDANLVADSDREHTTIVVSENASPIRVAALEQKAQVWKVSRAATGLNLRELMDRMGREEITSLLVEGGGETNASFFAAKLVQRVFFFYAPILIGGRAARKTVAGDGFVFPETSPKLKNIRWKRLAPDLMMTAQVAV
jgi:diaminohydroxyphosphoribosylaminopyrimidine deaminase/5-amino-6-(5-phosphoribosylamino)uracil reductase